MKLSTAQKILKIVGILTIIGAIVTIAFGALALFSTGSAIQSDPETMNRTEASRLGLMIAGGAGLVLGGVFDLVTGILSVLSSKNGKFAKTTLILTIISVAYTIINSIASYSKSGFTTSNVILMIVQIILAVLICVAANTAKVAYEEGREA